MNHEKLYNPLQHGYIRLLQIQVPESQASDHNISCSLSCIALTDVPPATPVKEESQDWHELSTAHWNYRTLFSPADPSKSVRRYRAGLPRVRIVATPAAPVSKNEVLRSSYIALSYVWGPSTQNKQILVNGHLCPVTDNLYAALDQLQHCVAIKTGLRIWVDALCIDQNNLEEKAYQIELMHKIYAQAQHVVIWLGPESPWTRSAFTAIS